MFDIYHTFPINAPPSKVFDAIATPEGLDAWWTLKAEGMPSLNASYRLYFGPAYDWNATITKYSIGKEFELTLTKADTDWLGARIGFTLRPEETSTEVSFYHRGWPDLNEHYRISSFCWAMYLRLLKRYIEFGEQVPYETRLDA